MRVSTALLLVLMSAVTASALTEADYRELLKDKDFARAERKLNIAWGNAKKALKAKEFSALQKDQKEWTARGRDEEARRYMEQNLMNKTAAYTIVTEARANYVSRTAKGQKLMGASITGTNVNVRNAPGMDGIVMYQVSSRNTDYDYDELLVVEQKAVSDKQGGKWYKVLYRFRDEGGESWFDRVTGYISAKFVKLRELSDMDMMLIGN